MSIGSKKAASQPLRHASNDAMVCARTFSLPTPVNGAFTFRVADSPAGRSPRPGDFIVVFTGGSFPMPTIQLQRLQAGARPWPVQTTFEREAEASGRFEEAAIAFAASARACAWRCCVNTGLMSLLASFA